MPTNTTLCFSSEMEASNVKVLELSTLEGIGVALLIASVGLIIRGMFMYYIKYKAPNDRPINKMIFHEQVSSSCFESSTRVNFSKRLKIFADIPIGHHDHHNANDYSTNRNPNTNV